MVGDTTSSASLKAGHWLLTKSNSRTGETVVVCAEEVRDEKVRDGEAFVQPEGEGAVARF